jgi:hypothetical protein
MAIMPDIRDGLVMLTGIASEPQRLDRDRHLSRASFENDDRQVSGDHAAETEPPPVVSFIPPSEIIWPRVWPGQ